MPQPVSPTVISLREFSQYARAWDDLVGISANSPLAAENTLSLQQMFTSANDTKKLLNYAYLPEPLLTSLLSAVGTRRIFVRMVVVEKDNVKTPSVVLVGIDKDRNPTSGFYLAGMIANSVTVKGAVTIANATAGSPGTKDRQAVTVEGPVDRQPAADDRPGAGGEPYPQSHGRLEVLPSSIKPQDIIGIQVAGHPAAVWSGNWNGASPSDLNPSWFTIIEKRRAQAIEKKALKGYTYKLSDFLNLMLKTERADSAKNSGTTLANFDKSLWLYFVLHEYAGPDATQDSKLFGMVLAMNAHNAAEINLSVNNYYYDISKPCPPACGPEPE